ncbi:MAG: hypothetical protein ACR2PX_12205 [Endozoicomonas sp.]|uniref:hypothetical protein n=1 Tax=Endozoicomonas sp. TaxID=1892382 RepID=UPI003D9B980B
MFLNRLLLDEKQAFLAIAHHLAHSDDKLTRDEENILAKYCMEMQMDDIVYNKSEFDLSAALDAFQTDSHKKIALLEIMALVFADGVLADEEQQLIDKIISHFDLNPNLAIVYREWSKSILSLFVQGEALIHL